jgi:nitroimidazol reductase NimA-like FMN-containing flavoprotein (pyridoxamine 5'-phosphate oxidase superfamily)
LDLEGLELLSEDECLSLLRQGRVGRVAVSVGEVPAVFPVNYMVGGEEILFFTAAGTKLRAAATNATVSFEVDHVDLFTQTGWSVLVAGSARERTEPAVIAGVKRAGLSPWAAGDRFHLVAVAIDFVSGRRIGEVIDLRRPPRRPRSHPVGPHSPVAALAQPPVRVGTDWTLQAASEAMREAKVSAVLVGRDHAIVTERDLTRALKAGLRPQDRVAAICVNDLIGVDEDATVIQAATHLLRHEIRHLVLHNWRGEVAGVVSLRDVVGVLVDAMDPAAWALLQESLSLRTEIE